MAGQSQLKELPQSTIRLIGSGQVITSVYSVVKELVENSFDARCTSLDIKLEDYGLEKIEVCDNGSGIKMVDVPYVAKRHYTSKLVTVDDLQCLETYGFRGEALASLCAVSDVTIATKTADDDVSYIYDIDGEGAIKGKKPSHLGTGTTVTACNLFLNLPVRKQFYSTSQRRKDDLKRIEDLLIVFSIIRPQIRITLRHDRNIIWQKMQMNDKKGALQSVLGRQVFSQLLYEEKVMDEPQGSVFAYLPKPGSDLKVMSRSAGDRTIFVVNERPVHVKELTKVVKRYYNNCHASDTTRFPICYVCIKLPASDVDVNMDPNKSTVLLKHLNEVLTCFEELLLKVYGPLDNVPNWHYSEAVKSKELQKNGDNFISVGSKILLAKKKPSENPVIDDMRGHDKSDTYNYYSASNMVQEIAASDGHKPLPNFSSEKSSDKCSGVISDFELYEQRKAINMCSNTELDLDSRKVVQNTHPANNFSEGINNTDISLECVNSCALSKNLISEKFAMESLTSLSSSENNLQINDCSKQIKEISCLNNPVVNLALQNKQNSFDTDNSFNIEAAKDNADNTHISIEDGMPLMNGSSWSMGHSLLSTCDKQLQPVKLLSPSPLQTPGKRTLSTSASNSSGCPIKQRKMSADILPAAQTTLKDIILDQSVSKMAFELFCKVRRPVLLESNPDEDRQAIDRKLEEAWKNLSTVERIKFRETCLPDSSKQENKELSKKSDVNDRTSDSVQLSSRDEATAKVAKKKTLKKRLYHVEKKLDCDVRDLRVAAEKRELDPLRIFYEIPTVIGPAQSCDAWLCVKADKLCLINVYRLGEAVLYKKLKEKHKLLAKNWQSPINLNKLLVTGNLWPTLEQLTRDSQTEDAYFQIKDERLVANGFDIRCHRDCEGQLQAELVGLCDLVPAYNVNDLREVLEIISRNPNVTLGDTRPTKVLYYLQGEVYRILQTSLCKKSVKDVQQLISQLVDIPDLAFCIHQRPVFHDLFDVNELMVNSASLQKHLNIDCN